jgi:hypothetical protein
MARLLVKYGILIFHHSLLENMKKSYTLHAEEFPRFAESIKSIFHGKILRITLTDNLSDANCQEEETDTDENEEVSMDLADLLGMDETEYWMRFEANKRRILQAIEDTNNRHNLIHIEKIEDLSNPEKLRELQERHRKAEAH